jgi:endonuclease/exonuclease/phosphatase family metal-dependent hydrolase
MSWIRKGRLVLCALLVGWLGSSDALCAEPPPLRVATYNIRTGKGMDGKLDLARTAAIIKNLQLDIVGIQEVDKGANRSGNVDQAAELGRLTGMHAEFAPAMDRDGGQFGVAMLSKARWIDMRRHVLPGVKGREPRAALAATFRVGEMPSEDKETAPAQRDALRANILGSNAYRSFVVVVTHLENQDETLRLKQIELLQTIVASYGKSPMLLLGDLNSKPTSLPMLALSRHWTDVSAQSTQKTFPADVPAERIDYVMFRPRSAWRVLEERVIAEPAASDHRPVLAVVQLIQPKKE